MATDRSATGTVWVSAGRLRGDRAVLGSARRSAGTGTGPDRDARHGWGVTLASCHQCLTGHTETERRTAAVGGPGPQDGRLAI